jgi:hypothetical protein
MKPLSCRRTQQGGFVHLAANWQLIQQAVVAVSVKVAVVVGDLVAEKLVLIERLPEPVNVGVTDPEEVCDEVRDPVDDLVSVEVRDTDVLGERDAERDELSEGLRDADTLLELEDEAVPVADDVPDLEGVPDVVAVDECEYVGEDEIVKLELPLPLGDDVGE